MLQPTPATPLSASLRISEVFDSVQGEGPSVGIPCTFLRLAGCNLACSWCDTPYSWDWRRFARDANTTVASVDQLLQRLRNTQRLVITGGEPLLQQRELRTLVANLPADLPVEVETNGTIRPSLPLLERVGQWNVSPKLRNSGEPSNRRDMPEALLALRDTDRAWLKFVVETAADADEAQSWATQLNWPRHRVQLMPRAARRDEYRRVLPLVQQWCAERELKLSPRLHVERWDGQRGI